MKINSINNQSFGSTFANSVSFKGNNQIIEKENVSKELCEFRRAINTLKADLKVLELKKIFCSGMGDKKGEEQCAKMIEKIKSQISDFL